MEKELLTKVFFGIKIDSSENEAKKIFKTRINPSIKFDASRGPVMVEGYQINKDARFKDIFFELGELSENFLSCGQIAGFCNRNPEKLSKNTTFFLTKKGEQYFVVPVDKHGPHEPCDFNCRGIWLGENLDIVVVPEKKK